MTTVINTNKINNIIFFNPRIIKDNDYKRHKYENLMDESEKLELEIYPKEEKTERQKQSEYKKFRTELYKYIRSSRNFCDGLQATYVKESLMECDFILRIESSQTRSRKLNGFATLKMYKGSKSFYIDVICTNIDIKGTGTYIINLLSKIGNVISLDAIKLGSTTKAVPFYLKSDFKCDSLCKMKKVINGGSKTRKNRITSNKSVTKRNY